MLYLAKRIRPDILLAVSFLATRVKEPVTKLNRLSGTKQLGLKLNGDEIVNITTYIDASYGVHQDYKSYTGIVISLGRGPIFCSSNKQKTNTKSSTEAEMVGVSDELNHAIWIRNFLTCQGYRLQPSTLYQDNMSSIRLLELK